MASDREQLLSMGFDSARVEWAIKATGGRGLQPAMDHILEHEGDPVPDLSQATSGNTAPATGTASLQNPDEVDDDEDTEALRAALKLSQAPEGAGGSAEEEAVARSIMCSECRKIFRNTDEANFHAVKSGHDQFEESTEEKKALTEEEKKQKLEELRERLAAKRATRSTQEIDEAKSNEKIRRKAGQDAISATEELKQKQILKDAEAKKREKIEEAKARAAVKAQIEQDKRERAEKAAREKALRDGTAAPVASAPSASRPAGVTAGASSDAKETRLQIRFASGGPPATVTLPSETPLRQVAEYAVTQNSSINLGTVTFTLQFPRKTFTNSDFGKSLKELGLTPSAALIAS